MKPYLIVITVVVILSIVGFLFFGSIGSNANRQGGSTRATNGTGAPGATTSIQNTTQALNSSLPIGPSAAAPRLIKTIPAVISGTSIIATVPATLGASVFLYNLKNGYVYVFGKQNASIMSGTSTIANVGGISSIQGYANFANAYYMVVVYDPLNGYVYAMNRQAIYVLS